jgi:hypothetical protein
MDKRFQPLEPDEIASLGESYVEDDEMFNLPLTFRPRELEKTIKTFFIEHYSRLEDERSRLLGEGIDGEVMRFGAKGWQKGKLRVKITLEFCPDEPAVEEPPASNKPEPSEPESPLDDIRRMIKEENQ